MYMYVHVKMETYWAVSVRCSTSSPSQSNGSYKHMTTTFTMYTAHVPHSYLPNGNPSWGQVCQTSVLDQWQQNFSGTEEVSACYLLVGTPLFSLGIPHNERVFCVSSGRYSCWSEKVGSDHANVHVHIRTYVRTHHRTQEKNYAHYHLCVHTVVTQWILWVLTKFLSTSCTWLIHTRSVPHTSTMHLSNKWKKQIMISYFSYSLAKSLQLAIKYVVPQDTPECLMITVTEVQDNWSVQKEGPEDMYVVNIDLYVHVLLTHSYVVAPTFLIYFGIRWLGWIPETKFTTYMYMYMYTST